MSKIIMSIVALIVLATAGYFVDPNFKAQINSLVGKSPSAPAMVATQSRIEVPAQGGAPSVDRLKAILDSGTLNASVQSPSKPFYVGGGSRATGFNVDFLNLMFKQGEFKGKVRTLEGLAVATYAEVPEQLLKNPAADIAIDGLTFNDEDLHGVVYTKPYVTDFGYSLITPKGVNIASVNDTVGMKIGVLNGDPDAKAFAESAFPGAKLVELSDRAGSDGKWINHHFDAGRVDAVVYDYPFAVAEVTGTNLQFAMTKIKGSDIQYRIGVRKGDKELLAALNVAITKAMAEPEYADMLKTYFMSKDIAATRRASSGEVSYIVVKGDTLGSIASAMLGDGKRYTDIQERNNLANPNFIAVGQKLVMPAK